MGKTYNICVAGYYFWPELIDVLQRQKNPVTMISHKTMEETGFLITSFPIYYVENIGLEFHCYNYYVQNVWKGGDVLFMHDDNLIGLDFFEDLNLPYDTTYIFKNERDEQNSQGRHLYGRHGRLIYCKEKVVQKLKDQGIWFDEGNLGYTTDHKNTHYNDGIIAFDEQCSRLGSIGAIHHYSVNCGFRGEIDTRP